MKTSASAVDTSAIGLSGLCVVHCLATPVVSAALPIAGTLAEAEWIHQLMVLTAVPITMFAVARHHASKVHLSFAAPAFLGLALLSAAAFVEALRDLETTLTVSGALLLASAHLWRWANRDVSSA
ncbi:MAG: MerC domain-containing protein [Pseudomonadota bacterium]